MFLLDTSAISEPGRPRPDPGYMAWFDSTPEPLQFTSVMTLGELRRGTEAMEPGKRRAELEAVQAVLLLTQRSQILPVTIAVGQAWADLALVNKRAGRKVGVVDELIAATASVEGMTVVTRNVRHFEHSGCRVLSPWSAP